MSWQNFRYPNFWSFTIFVIVESYGTFIKVSKTICTRIHYDFHHLRKLNCTFVLSTQTIQKQSQGCRRTILPRFYLLLFPWDYEVFVFRYFFVLYEYFICVLFKKIVFFIFHLQLFKVCFVYYFSYFIYSFSLISLTFSLIFPYLF